MLQNARVAAVTVSELVRENQQGEGGVKLPAPLPPIQIGVNQYFPVFSIFHNLSKYWIVHQLEEIFRKIIFALVLNFVFKLIYGFSQISLLNSITRCTYCSTNPRFNVYLKYLICTTYFLLLYKSHTSFLHLSIFQVRTVDRFDI